MENIIYIDNIPLPDIKKILEQWLTLYSGQLDHDFEFSLMSSETGFVIKSSKGLSNELFTFLVNYITYPENFDDRFYPNGYMTVTNTKYYPKEIIYKKMMVYVPADDKEYDLVYGTTEDNKTFVIDFGGKISAIENTVLYSEPKTFNNTPAQIVSANVVTENQNNKKTNDNIIIKLFRRLFP